MIHRMCRLATPRKWYMSDRGIWVILMQMVIIEKCKKSHARSRRPHYAIRWTWCTFYWKSDYWIPLRWNVFRGEKTNGKKRKVCGSVRHTRDGIVFYESRGGELVSPSNKRREIFSHPKWHEHTNIYFVRIRREGRYKKMGRALSTRVDLIALICGIHTRSSTRREQFFSNFTVEHGG